MHNLRGPALARAPPSSHFTPPLSCHHLLDPTPRRENQNFTKYVYFNSRVKTPRHPLMLQNFIENQQKCRDPLWSGDI